jgi:sulfatase modifying factor 1
VVVLRSDGTLQPEPDRLHVEVGPVDGGTPYRVGDYTLADATVASAGKYTLPATFAIDSNGDPHASASFVVSVSSTGVSQPLETLAFVVDPIPTRRVVELDVTFTAACETEASTAGEPSRACCPEQEGCTLTSGVCQCSGLSLPSFSADAGEAEPSLESGQSAEAGSAGPSTDADLPDGTMEGGADAQGADSESPACEAGAIQCRDFATPQQCTPSGQWVDEATPCQAGVTYCLDGICVRTPQSCLGYDDFTTCESYLVPGGTFLRGNDPLHEDAGAPATITTFRLDAFEVDLARFRPFVTAVILGTGLPSPGYGIHNNVAGDRGLNGGGDAGVYETGWDPAWSSMFPMEEQQWDDNLSCGYLANVWVANAVSDIFNELRPINCVTWYEAYAFCIWDGGFLPSEAEWNYAAAGGAAQRLYPWGSTDPDTKSQYAVYGCLYPQPTAFNEVTADNISNVDQLPMGVGAFGQWALAGNMAEWTLDFYNPTYPTPCSDCAELTPSGQRVFRGGSFDRAEPLLETSSRVPSDPMLRSQDVGFRCARVP